MSITASIIIPTHNRSGPLLRMLNSLEKQTYPKRLFEVIIVADGCRDNTAEMVRGYRTVFSLMLLELPGLGAASARNTGASMAKGRILVFADDDMELTASFVSEHIAAHDKEDLVVIGYSPFQLKGKAPIHQIILREWWEEKFQALRSKAHRFSYQDLTSGNFSISSSLFQRINGFDAALLCREDYELGFRLIRAGAEFRFAYGAKAFHCDEVTDPSRSFQRKRTEGMADIQIKKKHRGFINKEALFYLHQRSLSKTVLIKLIQEAPLLGDMLAGVGAALMKFFVALKMYSRWQRMNYQLLRYWYLRGLMKDFRSCKQLCRLMNESVPADGKKKIAVDLQKGLKQVAADVDTKTPEEIDFHYGPKFIGSLLHDPGSEPLRGIHLKEILKNQFSEELSKVLIPEIRINKIAAEEHRSL